MARDEAQLLAAKRSYRTAKDDGNRQEEARWANMIGDILKNRGQYVKALRWLRIDYDISVKYLPEKHVLPTCQSLGEVYLRLEYFEDALTYQKKHLNLAEDADDIVEQQRACTQLGRTYHEMFLRSENDYSSIRNAKKYFKSAMALAKILKENPPANKSSFLKEYIDAHNNLGMLEMDLDNLESAEKMLTQGLRICDEEEVSEDDDGRSRLHHNLGNVYMDLRKWNKAKEHIEKDIIICHRIGHCQGEAKGYVNLGELHYRVQKYEEAILCYEKALRLAKSMEDEDALVEQIKQNIGTVKEAQNVIDGLKEEELNLKKLSRNLSTAKGTADERKCLLQQNACLDRLIEKASTISAWVKHRGFAKMKKRVARELCDKEKLSDAFLFVGESYQKLRNFTKALKWYTRSWESYKAISNLEGQALAKINIGDVLDCLGEWRSALIAFEEGYRIAVESNLPSVQLSALENMHYSHMIRFENIQEARRLQAEIDQLKKSNCCKESENSAEVYCSETDTEGKHTSSDSSLNAPSISEKGMSTPSRQKSLAGTEELDDDAPLASFIKPHRKGHGIKLDNLDESNICCDKNESFPKALPELTGSQQTLVGRKRVRVILSDDESEMESNLGFPEERPCRASKQGSAIPYETKSKHDLAKPQFQDISPVASGCAGGSCNPAIEDSACSYKSVGPRLSVSHRNNEACPSIGKSDTTADAERVDPGCEDIQRKHSGSDVNLHGLGNEDQLVVLKIGNDLLHVPASSCFVNDRPSVESLKIELACLYYLQLPLEKRSKGLLPIIQCLECDGRILDSLESFQSLKDHIGEMVTEASIDGWVQKRLMKLYIESCQELHETPNMKLLRKLYISEIEDEVNVSECELQDISIAPLLNALQVHDTLAALDVSHNFLGNGTMEKLKQFFSSSSQRYGGLTLDLHCNRFGPNALFQICECPALFARLEVLNISGNRLTDSCGSYFISILENCKALYSLNIERCSLTSRTIQKVADALNNESPLSHLAIGYNNPISGNTIMSLTAKLATLKSFSELNVNGIRLSAPAADSISQLARTSSLSGLMLGGSGIGNDGALKLIESLSSSNRDPIKLDLSFCGLSSPFFYKFNSDTALVSTILELNVGGNPITQEGLNAVVSLLIDQKRCLRVLLLNKCQLGPIGILRLVQLLSDNTTLEELNLADNFSEADKSLLTHHPDSSSKKTSETSKPNADVTNNALASEADAAENKEPSSCQDTTHLEEACAMNTEWHNLEVADSEDDETRDESTSKKTFEFVQELFRAIADASHLQVLDLSGNGFTSQDSETLFKGWSSSEARSGLARRHVEGRTVHFTVEGTRCCSGKPCCTRES